MVLVYFREVTVATPEKKVVEEEKKEKEVEEVDEDSRASENGEAKEAKENGEEKPTEEKEAESTENGDSTGKTNYSVLDFPFARGERERKELMG